MKYVKTVSIIIPTYNRNLHYLSRAINSIKQQTYTHYEIIIVDDNICNSKYSLKIEKYCLHNNFIYIKTKGKEGANRARNIGANYSKGEYLAFLDDDDIWLPDKLKKQLESFTSDIAMVYTNGYVTTSNSRRLYTNLSAFVSEENLYRLLLYNYIGPTVAALIKKECFFAVGMFDETMPAKQDYELWIRIVKKYKIKGINDPLYLYMQHNSCQITKNYKLLLKGYQMIYEKNKVLFENDYILTSFFNLRIAKLYKYDKRYIKYCKYILCAFINICYAPLNTVF